MTTAIRRRKANDSGQIVPVVQEPLPHVLKFDFSAKLLSKKRDIEMSGTIAKTDWQSPHFKTAQQAAWAYVRGLLMFAGKWKCSINDEKRTIEVAVFPDGTIFRTDVETKKRATPVS